ncbi:MAG TPA: GDSL-type esterase/lipase family protein [Thermoanaerobaculia bacterium]|nr:GDSL-type esterase/lipase family protein [Thermoanaerobaculia bacterium]
MSKRLIGPLLLLLSLALSLLLGEGVLRLLSRNWLQVLDVEMWRYARFVKKASSYKDVVEEHRPNADAFLMGGRVRTDDHGFRLPDPATEARRQPGSRKVIALGDSLTFGWGVPEGETYADQLERQLDIACPRLGGRPVTVWNAGIGNCNTSMELARYRRFLRPLHPDWLILGYFVNDAEPDPVIPQNPLYWRSALAALASARFLKSSEVQLRDYKLYYHGLYEAGRPGWVRAQQALGELGALLREDGIPATLILLPELHEPRAFGTFADVYARVGNLGRESGFEVIDPSLDFPAGPGNAFWVSPDDAHPNRRAQAIFARALARSRYACVR